MSGRSGHWTQQAQHRELAVLIDGPWTPCWYWRDNLEAQQASACRMYQCGGTVELNPIADYRPTDEWVAHPIEPGVQGRAWRYHPRPPQKGN